MFCIVSTAATVTTKPVSISIINLARTHDAISERYEEVVKWNGHDSDHTEETCIYQRISYALLPHMSPAARMRTQVHATRSLRGAGAAVKELSHTGWTTWRQLRHRRLF